MKRKVFEVAIMLSVILPDDFTEDDWTEVMSMVASIKESASSNSKDLEDRAISFLATTKANKHTKIAEKSTQILDFLATGPKTKTELHHLFGRNLQAAELKALLTELENAGQIFCNKNKSISTYHLGAKKDAEKLQAEQLLDWLKTKKLDIVTVTDIAHGGPSCLRVGGAAKRAIEYLVKSGQLKPAPTNIEVRGRKRREAFFAMLKGEL